MLKKTSLLWLFAFLSVPIITQGQNNALDFDGADDRIVVSSPTGLDIANGTIELWLKTSGAGNSYRGLVTYNKRFTFVLLNNTLAVYDESTTATTTAGSALNDNSWHHVAFTFQAGVSNGSKLYVDGQLENTFTYNQNTGITVTDALIGANGSSQFYTGQMDEVRIWSDVRTQTEIQDNMSISLSGTEAGLEAYYTLNETSGTTAPDLTTNNNDGTLTNMDGSTDWVSSGRSIDTDLGNALDFDGTDDHVEIPFSVGTEYTIEMWFKADNVTTSNIIVYTSSSGVNTHATHSLILDANSKIFAYSWDGAAISVVGTTTIEANTWNHIAMTIKNGDKMRLYVNGIAEGTDDVGTMTTYTGTKFLLGHVHSNGSWPYYDGQIDELRIWNDVRTQQEIQDNMRFKLQGNEAGLAAYFDFDASSGTTLDDLTSNNNDGTLTNMDGNTDWVSSDAWLGASISNTAGFIMMSAPVTTSYSDILDEVWTQGATGADATNGSGNVWTWDNSSTGTANTNWTAVSDLGTNVLAGQGFLYYHFNDDNFDSTPNTSSTGISVSGTENENPVLSVNPNDEAWTLFGNPYASPINWNNKANSNNIYTNAQVWDPGASAWVTTTSNNIIAPFQGFFVQTFDPAGPSLNIGTGVKAAGSTFYGKRTQAPKLILSASSGDLGDEVVIQLHGDAELGHDRYDASKLSSLNADYVNIALETEDGLYALQAVPANDEMFEFPVIVDKASSGVVTLSLKESTLPTGYRAELVDLRTNQVHVIDESLELEVEIQKAEKKIEENYEPKALLLTSDETAQFKIVLIPDQATNTEKEQIASGFELYQNYPNPFNPTTTIAYNLERPAAVKLQIFDNLGRMVAEMIQGRQNAGMHELSWNATNQASGIYFYRMIVDGQIQQPMKMTLIK